MGYGQSLHWMQSFIQSTCTAWGQGQCPCPHSICVLLRKTDDNQGSKYTIPGGASAMKKHDAEQVSKERVIFYFFFNFFSTFILFLGQRETEHERGRGRERGRHRIGNRLQALSHQPRARRWARTHGPRDRDLAEVGRLTDCATQAPRGWYFRKGG